MNSKISEKRSFFNENKMSWGKMETIGNPLRKVPANFSLEQILHAFKNILCNGMLLLAMFL